MRIKIGYPDIFAQIPELANARSAIDRTFLYLTTDSREARSGDLFIPLCENKREAEKHIADAKARGAIILEQASVDPKPVSTLLRLASEYKSCLPCIKHTVMITGSVGKTTTKEILYMLSEQKYHTHKSEGNYNNEIGLPLSVLSAPKECEVMVLEAGMNHRGEISRLSQCAKPSIGIITAIGTSHIGNLGSREAIAAAKLEILDGMDTGVLLCDADEPLLSSAKMKMGFSTTNTNADYALIPASDGKEFTFYERGRYITDLHVPYHVKHIAKDIAAAVSAAQIMGIDIKAIKASLSHLDPASLRHRVIKTNYPAILDDSYNASLESVISSIDLLLSYRYSRSSALLGDILELGSHAEDIHTAIGEYAGSAGLSDLYLFGTYAKFTKIGALKVGFPEERIYIFDAADNLSDIAKFITENSKDDEMLLVKASHATNLSEIVNYFKGD